MEGSRGVFFYPESILAGHTLHDRCQVMCGPSPLPPRRGTLRQFEHHRQHRDAGETATGLVRASAPGGKRRFTRRGRPNVAPGLGGEISKRPSRLAVVGQTRGRLGLLRFISSHEAVQRHRRPRAGGRPPDGWQALLGLGLEVCGQCVPPLGRLMPPTPWPARLPIPLAERLPPPQRPIAHGQPWPLRAPAALESEEQGLPGLRALPGAIPEASQGLLAPGGSPQKDEHAMPRVLPPGRHGHASAPDRDLPVPREVALWPLRQCVVPSLLPPAPRGRSPPRRLGAQEGLYSLGEISGRDALEGEPGPQGRTTGGAAQIGGQERRRQASPRPTAGPPPWPLPPDGADACGDVPLGERPRAYDGLPSLGIMPRSIRGQEQGDVDLQSLGAKPLGSRAEALRARSRRGERWMGTGNDSILWQGVSTPSS